MKFRERWKLAGTISSEIRFKGYLDANPSNLARIKEEPEREYIEHWYLIIAIKDWKISIIP